MLCLISQVLAFAAATYAATFDPEALFGPRVSEGTLIASANDSHFSDVVSPRWSSWEAPGYVAAIKPVTEADVQAIVRPSWHAFPASLWVYAIRPKLTRET